MSGRVDWCLGVGSPGPGRSGSVVPFSRSRFVTVSGAHPYFETAFGACPTTSSLWLLYRPPQANHFKGLPAHRPCKFFTSWAEPLQPRRPATEKKNPEIPKIGEQQAKIGKIGERLAENKNFNFANSAPTIGISGFFYSVAGRRGRI